jgi:hypothetical protein
MNDSPQDRLLQARDRLDRATLLMQWALDLHAMLDPHVYASRLDLKIMREEVAHFSRTVAAHKTGLQK